MAGEGKDAGISGSGKKIQNVFKKVVDGCRALIRFIRTGIGIVVLKITLIVLLLIFIYILAQVIFASIAKLIGIEGPGASEANKSSEFLQNLSNSGYDAMLNADQLTRYYTYEYAVLMDVGEYLEEVGVSTIEKQDEGTIDWSSINRHEWALLAAHGFAENSNYDSSIIANVPNGWVSKNPDYNGSTPGSDECKPAPSGEFYYRITNNEYTKEKALMPYFRITRNDFNLRYYFEFDSGLPDEDKDVTFSITNNDAQQSMAVIGSKYNIVTLKDPNKPANIGIRIFGKKFRFEAGGVIGGAEEGDAAAFIEQYVYPVFYQPTLNAVNAACGGAGVAGEDQVDLNLNYTSQSLFYDETASNVIYEVSLRSLLDRFLPNASLLSSWRLLTNDGSESAETGSVAEDLVNDIITVYDDASLNGEDQKTKLFLLKDVGKITAAIDDNTAASTFIEDTSTATEDVLDSYYDSSIKLETDYNAYVPKFDTRDIPGYVSIVNQTAERATSQNFTGSFADDVIDDVKLAISHYIHSSNNKLTTEQVSEINNALSSALGGIATPTGDMDPVTDIVIYLNGYYECTDKSHYDIPASASASDIVMTSELLPVKHTVVKVNGTEVAHKSGSYDDCKSPFLKISYKIDKGIKTTGVILHGGDLYFAYQIKGRELLTYDDYTNNYAFAHLESGNMKSTTFKHWEFAWLADKSPEDSYESWFVTDAFEGVDYSIDPDTFSVKIKIEKYVDGDLKDSDFEIPLDEAVDINEILADIPPNEIYSLLVGKTVTDSDIFSKNSFAIVRDVSSYSSGGTVTVPSRVENAYANDKELAKYPENAYISSQTAADIGRNSEAQCSYTDEYGETIITINDYLMLKSVDIRSDQDLTLDIDAVKNEIIRRVREKIDITKSLQKYIYTENFDDVKHWTGVHSYTDVPLSSFRHESSEEEGWRYKNARLDITNVGLIIGLHVVFPTRISIQPISQRVIDKEMPGYFVKYANYWAAEKDFHNVLKIQGEFKDHGDWHYLVTNNGDAQGIKDILSDYKSVKWRCDLFAPIFGSVRKDNSGREADIKLILSEWEKVAETGVGAADHAIRDLYALIMYSKGIRDTQKSASYSNSKDIPYVAGFEPKKRSNGEAMINENSYSYLYIPYEILGYDPLNSEKAFWLDRIICTPNDAIYDKTITATGSTQTNEAKLRSRTPVFTWQVVDYDLYDETEIIDSSGNHTGQHAVYALWPFGDQMSRMLYAISANASDKENTKIKQWGGTTTAHAAADLYGRTEAERIYDAAFEGKKSIQSSRRTMVNQFYGYGYFEYGGVTSKIKARYVPAIGDVLLFEGDREIKDGETINIGGVDVSLDSTAALNEEIDWEAVNETYSLTGTTGGTGLYFNNTPVTLKLGKRKYTFEGTAGACYAFELYRQALALKDTSGTAAEKIVRNKLEKEMKWQEVRAIAPGVVDAIGGDAVSGFWVKVVHSGATKVGSEASMSSEAPYVSSSYCHMKRYPVVQVGQYVGAGTVLGYEGTTGKSGGFHVHMNIKEEGDAAYPVYYLYPFFTPFWYAEKSAQVLGAGITDEIDEAIMADYQDKALNGNETFLDSEYFSSARTVFPFGQVVGTGQINTNVQSVTEGKRAPIPSNETLKQAESTKANYLKIKNYIPHYALISNVSYLKQEEDGKDFSALSTKSNVSTDLGKPEYSGDTLHTNPKFSDVTFMKKVMRNMGRIHGSYPGLMQSFSFTGGNVDKVAIWNELMLVIGNPYGVAGVMGNIQSESSFNSKSLNVTYFPDQYKSVTGEQYTEMVDNGTCPTAIYLNGAYGLCQWLHGRQEKLIKYADEFGVSVSDGSLQLNYCISELQSMSFGEVGYTSYYPANVQKYAKKMTLLEILQDEDMLYDMGLHAYESSEFKSTLKDKYEMDNLSIDEQKAALKTIGATILILHNYECPGGQEPTHEAGRSNHSLDILAEMTEFGN